MMMSVVTRQTFVEGEGGGSLLSVFLGLWLVFGVGVYE